MPPEGGAAMYLAHLRFLAFEFHTGVVATLRRRRSALPIAGRRCSRHITITGGVFGELEEMKSLGANEIFDVLFLL